MAHVPVILLSLDLLKEFHDPLNDGLISVLVKLDYTAYSEPAWSLVAPQLDLVHTASNKRQAELFEKYTSFRAATVGPLRSLVVNLSRRSCHIPGSVLLRT